MSIVYPLTMPATPLAPKQIQLAQNFIVAEFPSPYTAQQQIYEHQGSWWTARVDLPPMKRATAAPWLALLAALNGKSGTLLLGDPLAVGPVGSAGGSPIVSGAGQSGKQLSISGLTGTLKAGDMFHIGSVGENLLLFSQAFTNAVWTLINSGASNPVVTDNAIVAPDGTTTAATVAFPSTVGGAVSSSIRQLNASGSPVPAAGTPFMLSIWLKLASGTGTILLYNADGVQVAAPGSPLTASLTASWQRFSIAGVYPSSASGGPGMLLGANNQAAITVHAWGAQVERGAVMNNYIPTLAATTSSTRRLYMNLTDQGPGSVTLDIFPRLRTVSSNANAAPLAGEALILANPQGLFRLDSNSTPWSVETAGFYNISFGVKEAF